MTGDEVDEHPWLTVAEAAVSLRVSEAHVYRHAPLRRIGRRALVPAAWVFDWEPPEPEPPVELRKPVIPSPRKASAGTPIPEAKPWELPPLVDR
jgi:hypothetical protein